MSAASATVSARAVSPFALGLMASVTFVGILSELVPSGVLPQMSEGLGVAQTQVGLLVGGYALASAICAIPLVGATLTVNRKRLLLALLVGFAASNLLVGFSSSYAISFAARILGGLCAGAMWPMIAAYGSRLVPADQHGKTITVIMSGNTLGISIGLPAMAVFGASFGWRSVFLLLGAVVAAIAVLSHFYLPSVQGEKVGKGHSPLAILKNPKILIVLLLTLLSVTAHYGSYTYIALLVERLGFDGGIGLALLIFGIGSTLSVFLSAKYIDAFLRPLIVIALLLGGGSMMLLPSFEGMAGVSHASFFLWGLAFGPLVTVYQTAVLRHVDEARDVATSVQSSVFNFSIMAATWLGGLMIARFPEAGVRNIVHLSLGCFAVAALLAFCAKRTLRSIAPEAGAQAEALTP